MPARECSRTACSGPAVSTLTYVYADSVAVLGPLSRTSEPHSYDLCADHSARLTVPRGWRVIRVPGTTAVSDDLVALADAVHGPAETAAPAGSRDGRQGGHDVPAHHRSETPGRHLHVIRDPHE